MKIAYPGESLIHIIDPSDDYPIEEVCRKDVPFGVPYLILKDEQIPESREKRDAMTLDFSTPDGIGADYGAGTNRHVLIYDEEKNAAVVGVSKEIIVKGKKTMIYDDYQAVNDGAKYLERALAQKSKNIAS